MNADLHAAWLTAGDNLQPIGHWLASNWPNLTIAAALAAFAWWSIRRGLHNPARHHIPAGLWAGCWGGRRITDAIRRRRATPRSIRQLENYANHPANRTRKEDR